jgi:hypothetical protein
MNLLGVARNYTWFGRRLVGKMSNVLLVLRKNFDIRNRCGSMFLGDICRIVESTIILHNMMVEHRVEQGETEDIS